MNCKKIILTIVSMAILGLIISGISWFLLRRYYPRYTAQTYIKVLPPIEKDPAAIGGTMVSKDIQYGHRLSVASLIKQQSTLQNLIDRDIIQQTKWFKRFGKSKAISIRKAYKDLTKHFGAFADRDTEFVSISMTCSNKQEATLIVNEMLDLFLYSQRDIKRAEVAAKLKTLKDQRLNVQRDLRLAEDMLVDILKNSGFTDLEERSYPHPVITRLNRLELEQDNCILQIAQQQANIKILEKRAKKPGAEQPEHQPQTDLNNVRDYLIVLQSKLDKLTQLRDQAAEEKKQFDLARVQYERQTKIRDERQKMLDELKTQIEKRTLMHDDPETPKVQFVGYAPVPLEISSPKWQVFIPAGTIAGLILGIGLALSGRKTNPHPNKKI